MKEYLVDGWWKNPHFSPMYLRSNPTALDIYSSKIKTRVLGPFDWGIPPERVSKEATFKDAIDHIKNGGSTCELIDKMPYIYARFKKQIQEFVTDLKEKKIREKIIANNNKRYNDKIKIILLYGDAGEGKTRFVEDNHNFDEIYTLTKKNNSVFFQGYKEEKILVIDEFSGWINFENFKIITDKYMGQVIDIKGSHGFAFWETVYVISNKHPEKWYPNLTNVEKKSLIRRFDQIILFEGGKITIDNREDKFAPICKDIDTFEL